MHVRARRPASRTTCPPGKPCPPPAALQAACYSLSSGCNGQAHGGWQQRAMQHPAAALACCARRCYDASSSGCCCQNSSRMMSQCSTQGCLRCCSLVPPSAVGFCTVTCCRMTTEPCSSSGQAHGSGAQRTPHQPPHFTPPPPPPRAPPAPPALLALPCVCSCELSSLLLLLPCLSPVPLIRLPCLPPRPLMPAPTLRNRSGTLL